MGTTVANAVSREQDLRLVGGVDVHPDRLQFTTANGQTVPAGTKVDEMVERMRPHVMVDFTRADAARVNLPAALERGVHVVVGTTGLDPAEIQQLGELAKQHNCALIIAPNFALSAVLMMHVCKIIGKYLDYCDIVELHHERKIDAPSGTALQTARAILAARGRDMVSAPTEKEMLPGTRGGVLGGINIHAVRLPGLVAHQQVTFGGLGQTLTIRQDSTSTESFMPGVLMAIREAPKRKGLTHGLEELLGLS